MHFHSISFHYYCTYNVCNAKDESNGLSNFCSDHKYYLANIHGKVRSQCRNPRHTFYEYPINKLDNLMNILAQYLYPCTVVKSVAY